MRKLYFLLLFAVNFVFAGQKPVPEIISLPGDEWVKYPQPVLGGGDLGTVFDLSVLKEEDVYQMYSSWRTQKSIALSTSEDGVNWTRPQIVLSPKEGSVWEHDLNRPAVLKKDNVYHMWYTGQADGKSCIGYATSSDGIHFLRKTDAPVLVPEKAWEKVAVMCPHVIWDEGEKCFKMWYSGGEQYEPDAIGYATSKDGVNWKRLNGPVFKADPKNGWEKYKVTACQVIKRRNDYLMFYIGFRDINYAQIGIAVSKNGIDSWQRYPGNPIISPTRDAWDADACYKPYVIQEKDHWKLWYNGRRGHLEQIGLALFRGSELFSVKGISKEQE